MKMAMFFFCVLLLPGFQTDKKTFSRLYALQGTWKSTNGETALYETWKKTNDQQLNGNSYSVTGKDTSILETMVLGYKGKQVVFTAITVKGQEQAPTAFTLSHLDKNSFFFENPTHDYPKRVIYELVSKDSLHAWIDGGENAEGNKRIDYYFRKIQ